MVPVDVTVTVMTCIRHIGMEFMGIMDLPKCDLHEQ